MIDGAGIECVLLLCNSVKTEIAGNFMPPDGTTIDDEVGRREIGDEGMDGLPMQQLESVLSSDTGHPIIYGEQLLSVSDQLSAGSVC